MEFTLGVLLILSAQIWATSAHPTCTCENKYQPVCGSDGQTYHNACALECARSSSKQQLRVTKQEPCYGGNIAGVCGCSTEYKPVCGTNRYTYPNVCHLDCMAGRTVRWNITVAYDGECLRIPDDPDCNCAMLWSPVCGSNDVTYDSQCPLDCAISKDPTITYAYNNRCNPRLQYYIENFTGVSYPLRV